MCVVIGTSDSDLLSVCDVELSSLMQVPTVRYMYGVSSGATVVDAVVIVPPRRSMTEHLSHALPTMYLAGRCH